ncbi:MAG: NADH-quinone oxidoreductase subunit A, partial [Phycisphaerae bacterium]
APSVMLVVGVCMLIVAGFLICFGGLMLGRFVRPRISHPEKDAIYECGEPSIGEGWVQFDLRFYVVALVFIIFDVEIALFWPWAVVYGGGTGATGEALRQLRTVALYDMLFFFGVIVVGFMYLWRYGYLDWVRATATDTQGERQVSGVEAMP